MLIVKSVQEYQQCAGQSDIPFGTSDEISQLQPTSFLFVTSRGKHIRPDPSLKAAGGTRCKREGDNVNPQSFVNLGFQEILHPYISQFFKNL